MKRNAIKRLMEWKDSTDKKPIWIIGAKGVGKTFLMLDFAKSFYDGSIYINFEKDQHVRSLFQKEVYSISDDRNLIELICESYQIKYEMAHQIVFLLDEITECPEAVTLLEDYAEMHTGFSVIITGSSIEKIPVNNINFEYIKLYPLNFDEFVISTGSEWYIDIINAHFNNHRKIPDIVHDDLLNLFEDYLVIGGMPSAVNDYLINESTNNTNEIHENIRAIQYHHMIKSLSDTDALKTKQIMDIIPAQLYKDNRKFQYRMIRKGVTYNLFSAALHHITDNGYAISCNKMISETEEDQEAFKLYSADIGILFSEYTNMVDINETFISDKLRKIVLENYTIQQLKSNGISTFFWESGTQAKLDFVYKSKDGSIPIEVVEKDGKRSKSLGVYKNIYNCPYSYKLSNKNFTIINNNVYNIPFYAVYCITADK